MITLFQPLIDACHFAAKKKQKSVGMTGEDVATQFLKEKGYKILERNWCNTKGRRLGEIDIVAQSADKTIVFVEVKTREIKDGQEDIMPEEQITAKKLQRMQRAIECYINAHDLWASAWRCDAVAILLRNGRVRGIKHIEHIYF